MVRFTFNLTSQKKYHLSIKHKAWYKSEHKECLHKFFILWQSGRSTKVSTEKTDWTIHRHMFSYQKQIWTVTSNVHCACADICAEKAKKEAKRSKYIGALPGPAGYARQAVDPGKLLHGEGIDLPRTLDTHTHNDKNKTRKRQRKNPLCSDKEIVWTVRTPRTQDTVANSYGHPSTEMNGLRAKHQMNTITLDFLIFL